jgi:fluoride exporter
MGKYMAIALGGAIGALARFIIGNFISTYVTSSFPWGTFIINITGSFIIGFFLTLISDQIQISPNWRLAIAVGFVGAYTTFSTFEFEILKLIENNNLHTALLYVTASVLIGFLAVWGGAVTARGASRKAIGVYKNYRMDGKLYRANLEKQDLGSEDSKND